jgi:hypothetical protein
MEERDRDTKDGFNTMHMITTQHRGLHETMEASPE